MKPYKKAVWAAHTEGRDWHKELFCILAQLSFNAMHHHKSTPVYAMFNHVIRTMLSQLISKKKTEKDTAIHEGDEDVK